MTILRRGNPAPFAHYRGTIGCLLLHGFPGSPAEMRLLGDYLAERDISTVALLFPGMGMIPEDLIGVRWQDWVAAAEAGLTKLRQRCSTVFVCGLSMGGATALNLAARLPVAGAIALAPAIRIRDRRFEWAHILSLFIPWRKPDPGKDDLADPQGRALAWHYLRYPTSAVRELRGLVRATRQLLPQISAPTLIVQSPRDSTLIPEGARWALQQIPAVDKTLIWLERSGHNVLIDLEKEEVCRQIYRFIARVSGLEH